MPETGEIQRKKGRGAYSEPYRVLAVRYGIKVRSAKRWVAVGRENGDPCPLDDARGMVGWWTRNMKQRVPQEILAAAGPDVVMEIPVARPAAVVKPEPVAEAEVVVSLDLPDGLGLEAELGRIEELARRLSVKAHEPGQAKAYLDTVARMGTLSEKLRSEAEKMKKLLPRDVVEAAIVEFHGPIEREVRLLYRTMVELIGLGPSPEKEDLWNRELDRLFVRFREEVLAV